MKAGNIAKRAAKVKPEVGRPKEWDGRIAPTGGYKIIVSKRVQGRFIVSRVCPKERGAERDSAVEHPLPPPLKIACKACKERGKAREINDAAGM